MPTVLMCSRCPSVTGVTSFKHFDIVDFKGDVVKTVDAGDLCVPCVGTLSDAYVQFQVDMLDRLHADSSRHLSSIGYDGGEFDAEQLTIDVDDPGDGDPEQDEDDDDNEGAEEGEEPEPGALHTTVDDWQGRIEHMMSLKGGIPEDELQGRTIKVYKLEWIKAILDNHHPKKTGAWYTIEQHARQIAARRGLIKSAQSPAKVPGPKVSEDIVFEVLREFRSRRWLGL